MRNTHPLIRRSVFAGSLFLAACNQPPDAPVVTLAPEAPTTVDDLVAQAEVPIDPNGDEVTLAYAWFVDGSARADLKGATVPAAETTKGQSWVVEVTASDDKEASPVGTATVIIANSPPVGTVEIIPALPTSAEGLTATATATDDDDDTVSWSYVWTKDGQATGITGPDVAAAQTARGEVWAVTASPYDGEADGETIQQQVSIDNAPPVVLSVELEATPRAGTPVQAVVVSSDSDGDSIALSYAWTVNGAPAGANTDALPSGTFARGDTVAVTVIPNDGTIDGEGVTSADVDVVNAIPTIAEVVLTPTPMFEASTVTCTPVGWVDGDNDREDYTWRWTVNGAPAGTAETLDGAFFDKGDDLTCTATPTDGRDVGLEVTSDVVVVSNTPPVLYGAEFTNPAPAATDTLSLELGEYEDDDGDPVEFTIDWYVNDVFALSAPALPPSYFMRDDAVRAEVTPNDREDDGVTVLTNTIEVGNSRPEVSALAFDPDPPTAGVDLVAVATALDPDGDDIELFFEWTLNGEEVLDISGDTLPLDRFVRGDQITVSAVADDGFAGSLPFVLGPVAVANTVPTIDGVHLEPAPIYEASVVSCVGENWVDPDGDEPAYDYTWSVDGMPLPSSTESIDGAWFDKGMILVCTATPRDAFDTGDLSTSDPVVVSNSAPVLDAALIENDQPRDGEGPLTVQLVNLRDDDTDDVITLSYVWYVDNVPVSTATELTDDLYRRGNAIYVEIAPTDGIDTGASVFSPAVPVLNSAPRIDSVNILPVPPMTESTLMADVVAADPDDDPIDYLYAWFVDGVEVSGETGPTLAGDFFVKTQTVWVTVTASDDSLTSPSTTSPSATIVNSPPEAPVVRVNPRWAMTGKDDLVCEILTPARDPDGENVTYEFTWTVNGALYGERGGDIGPTSTLLPGDTVPAADVGEGQQWVCSAVGTDVTDVGAPGASTAFSQILDLRSLSAGDGFTCGIDPDDRVRCWGLSPNREAVAPDGAFKSLGTGFNSACAIALDGSLSCWGGDAQIGSPPPGIFRQVAVGTAHACAVGANRVATCWGADSAGQATPPIALFDKVVTGFFHSCGLLTDGTVACWGDNGLGQAPTTREGTYRDISAGLFFNCGVLDDGTLDCWGAFDAVLPEVSFSSVVAGGVHACAIAEDDTMRCFGDDSAVDFTLDDPTATWARVAAGSYHTCALGTDGTTRCWGRSDAGQTFPPNTRFDHLAPGGDHTCGLSTGGDITCFGLDDVGQASPMGLGTLNVAITSGDRHSCALGPDLIAQCWGDDAEGQLSAPISTLSSISAGGDHTCGIDDIGSLVCWGRDADGESTPPSTGAPWSKVTAGGHHTCGIDANGDAVCWGSNASGETDAPAGTFVDIDAGAAHVCAITDTGSLACWGNPTHDRILPPAGTDWTQVVSSGEHSCAVNMDGLVACWGNNAESRLDAPAGVYLQLDAGRDHTCGLRDDGTTPCWGLYAH